MGDNKNAPEVSAGKFMDELVSDILSAPNQEIMEDDEELSQLSGVLTDEFIAKALESALISRGKERFRQAARELEQGAPQDSSRVVDLDRERLRRDYEESLRRTGNKVSMAARSGAGVSERDVNSAIEDLAELGGIDDQQTDDE